MLTGNYLQNFDSFRYAINSEPVQDNVIKLNSDNNVFYFQDGSVWMFQEYHLTEPSLKAMYKLSHSMFPKYITTVKRLRGTMKNWQN